MSILSEIVFFGEIAVRPYFVTMERYSLSIMISDQEHRHTNVVDP